MKTYKWAPPQLPIVLLDVDGVIADNVTAYIKYTNEVLGTYYTVADINQHDLEKSLNLLPVEGDAIRKRIDNERMARWLRPLPGAIEGVLSLSRSAHVLFVTARLTSSQTWCWDRSEWLDRYLGDGWGKKAQFVKDKYLFTGDIFVDDSPENVERWAIQNRWNHSAISVLWRQPYNEKYEFNSEYTNIIRTNSWERIESLVWERTKKKDNLSVWIDNNKSLLRKYEMKFVAVNPYIGFALFDESLENLINNVSLLSEEIRKDIIIYFNTAPVNWNDGQMISSDQEYEDDNS